MPPADIAGAISNSFIKEGILGTIIVVLLIACLGLWKAYTSSNEARITEANTGRDKHVDLLEKVMDALKDNNTILQIVKDRMGNRRS